MRRTTLTAAVLLLAAAACAPSGAGKESHRNAAGTRATDGRADIYAAVLRRYLTTPAESSFPGQRFSTVYVLDRADPKAADPMHTADPATSTSIPAATQRRIVAALRPIAPVRFVASRDEVVVRGQGVCGQVRDGGILIMLAPPTGNPPRVQVGLNGFVACDGATWLTYVVDRGGSGWAVSGTTGPSAIS